MAPQLERVGAVGVTPDEDSDTWLVGVEAVPGLERGTSAGVLEVSPVLADLGQGAGETGCAAKTVLRAGDDFLAWKLEFHDAGDIRAIRFEHEVRYQFTAFSGKHRVRDRPRIAVPSEEVGVVLEELLEIVLA